MLRGQGGSWDGWGGSVRLNTVLFRRENLITGGGLVFMAIDLFHLG